MVEATRRRRVIREGQESSGSVSRGRSGQRPWHQVVSPSTTAKVLYVTGALPVAKTCHP